jgi:hypothetical protein
MQEGAAPPLLGGPLEDKARKAVEDYLRGQETNVYNRVLAEALKHLPDPAQPLKELIETMRTTLAIFGITAQNEEIAKQLAAIMPQEIVKPIVELYGVLVPRMEWAMGQILDNAQVAVDQLRNALLAPVEAKIREIFHLLFTAVTKKAAQIIGKLVDAAVTRLIEIVTPILQRLVATVMAALLMAIGMAVAAMLELVNTLGRMALKFAKAVAYWIARKIVMFVCKTILRLIGFLFGLPAGAVEASLMETEAMMPA